MTIVSTFYDALVSKIAGIWPDAFHIANVYQLEGANSLMLQDGYAISIGPSVAGQNQSCQELFTREILIVRIRLLVASENATISTSVKSLLEDHFDLRKALRLDNQLGGVVSDIGFVSDGGIELLEVENGAGNYHVMSSVYSVIYLENLY